MTICRACDRVEVHGTPCCYLANCPAKCPADPVAGTQGDLVLDQVVEAVRADLHKRSQVGIGKYGTTLDENPAEHRERLQHAYEEALDLSNYLKWHIMKLDEQAAEEAELLAILREADRMSGRG